MKVTYITTKQVARWYANGETGHIRWKSRTFATGEQAASFIRPMLGRLYSFTITDEDGREVTDSVLC